MLAWALVEQFRAAFVSVVLVAFGGVRDSLGRAAGGVLFWVFAGRVDGWVRLSDSVVLLGGLELVVLQAGLTVLVDATVVGVEVLAVLDAALWVWVGEHRLGVGLGVAVP
ncbi:hypothetical protein SAMN05192530_10265 [Aureimonas jatrophae]|uniref:Uncharacterized protein n=1 Tax=Aureimonas jatrophae TaxID=1166073 RepID=A0A1H0EJC0_9HYPH|nr:hypothetical protein SAMN05192530_10265 [Aureimonas jatrophae]